MNHSYKIFIQPSNKNKIIFKKKLNNINNKKIKDKKN